MLSLAIVGSVAFIVSLLTLFSGFGLGTLLMPVFALFFPLPVAISATAVVHLANNMFKLVLLGKNADWPVVVRFAVPGAIAAIGGALLLRLFEAMPVLHRYAIGTHMFEITPIKLCIGLIILLFSTLELLPFFNRIEFSRQYLWAGGFLSGFFGGLSGHQGVLRSAFLIRTGLSKEAFVATSVVAAVIVDVVRLVVYGLTFYQSAFSVMNGHAGVMIIIATVSAFAGAFTGKKVLKKITITLLQRIVAVALILMGTALAVGMI